MTSRLRRYVRLTLLAAMLVASAGNGFAATISGTVTNITAKSGRIYLKLVWDGWGDFAGCGKTLATAGAFTIRGAPDNGMFRIFAFQDTTGNDGVQIPADPIGESGVIQINNGSVVSGLANVTLKASTEYLVPTPRPVSLYGAGGNGFAMIEWDRKNRDSAHGETFGNSLVVEWSKDNFATKSTRSLTRFFDSPLYIDGLVNGLTYKLRVKSLVGTQTAMSNVVSVAIGPPSGGYRISGTVAISGFTPPPNTPLLIYVYTGVNPSVGRYAAVTNGMAFSVSGVPNGRHAIYAGVDMNKNGAIDAGDALSILTDVAVNGADVGGKTLSFNNASARTVVESHVDFRQDNSRYDSIWFMLQGARKQPINVFVTGPNLPEGLDLGFDEYRFAGGLNNAASPVVVGDTYTFATTFTDGSSANLSKAISAVYANGPTNLKPSGLISTSPAALSWTLDPNPALAKGRVTVDLWTGQEWLGGDLPANATSYTLPEPLANGEYTFSVRQCDFYKNCVSRQERFTIAPKASKPAKLTVPVSSPLDQTYTISWSPSMTPGATYELQESILPTFATAVTYPSYVPSFERSQYSVGTFYYRVRAVAPGYIPSPWTTAANGCAVPGTSAAGIPVSLTVPVSDADGGYVLNWGTSPTGGVTYILEESTGPAFGANLRTAYAGPATTTNILGRALNKTYYYRVRAIKAGLRDSGWKVANNGCAVPGTVLVVAPTTITVPASDTDGAYAVNWGASSTTGATYWLQEATNAAFSANLRTVYSGSSRTVNITGRTAGKTYYYRVRAIKAGFRDSAWKAGANGCVIGLP